MKMCCGEERSEPFCSVCGKRLTENRFIGATVRGLMHEIDQFGYELQSRSDASREHKRVSDKRQEELDKSLSEAAEQMRLMREALDHAKRHNIGTDS